MQQSWVDEPLFDSGAVIVTVGARWTPDEGWHLWIGSRTAVETARVPDDERQDPTTAYERLSTLELVDVLTTEVDRRRRF